MASPSDLQYTDTHEWVRDNGDGTVTVGITDHAQQALGELVYAELPQPGRLLAKGEACAVVESTKAASDVYAPVAGEVIEGNVALADAPETVNADPEGAGWFAKIKVTEAAATEGLMDRAAYDQYLTTL